MRAKLTEVFTAPELQLAQVAIAKASGGCSVFFNAEAGDALSSATSSVGRRVSLCCFNQELSMLCGKVAHEQGRISGAHIADAHKCRCGATFYWVKIPIHNETGGFCQVRNVDPLSRSGSHLVASYLRTLASIGNVRLARSEVASDPSGEDPSRFVSLDHHHLYGHPNFPALIRMVSEAGRSLLHASRCVFLSYDSSDQTLSGEFASDLSQEHTHSIQLPLREFPHAREALDTLKFVVAEHAGVPANLMARLRPIVGDGRFVVLPLWVVGHMLGFLVYSHVKSSPERIVTPLSVPKFAEAASGLLAVLGYRVEVPVETEDEPTQVGIIQRYAAMGQMAAEIGHDIQASLYGMKNYAYLLSKSMGADARKQTYTRAISEGIAYIERLSSEMRKLSGEPRHVTFAPTDVVKVIDSAVLLFTPLATERGIVVVKEIPGEVPTILADSNALTEVFLNLGINAIHSMSQGGEIRITVEPQKDRLSITFRDNGSGITPEILERFWNNSSYAAKSFTNKGLYIIRRIVRQHHGRIELDTTPGVGTAFFIDLWINPKAAAPKPLPSDVVPVSFQPPEAELPTRASTK